jgi:DNA invertase Pin-like site-specific DNA recombinase
VDGPLLVVAGPGSGKTYSIVLRALNLLLLERATAKEIVLCTFTEKAAFEMRDRLSAAAQKVNYPGDLSELRVTTIHGLCNWIAFVSLAEGIDATTPAGKLQMHILAAIAEFERARIAERVRAGLARARAQGQRLGRRPHRISSDDLERVRSLSTRKAAAALGVPASVLHRARLARIPKSAIA